jgi:hypothetical protein
MIAISPTLSRTIPGPTGRSAASEPAGSSGTSWSDDVQPVAAADTGCANYIHFALASARSPTVLDPPQGVVGLAVPAQDQALPPDLSR